MIDGLSVLALIPARGGSKRVPRKNIQQAAGKPLLAWTIDEARKSKYIDRLILSSEDQEIISVARAHGCEVPFVRPAELSRDETAGVEPVLHALSTIPGYDLVVLLQPTSPLRTVEDIDGCIETCIRARAKICVSVTELPKRPEWLFRVDSRERLVSAFPAPAEGSSHQPLFALNGAVYVAFGAELARQRTFLTPETAAYVMPQERSLDIDTPFDLFVFEQLKSAPRA